MVVADERPERRIAFGTAEQARSFADRSPGWSVIGDMDPRWRPITGESDGSDEDPGPAVTAG